MAATDNSFLDGEEEEETNDYSSYWQSIPDPPTPITATTTTAASGVEVAKKSTAAAGVEVAKKSSRRRNRKRDSFAFRDVTNHQVLNGDENNNFVLGDATAAAASAKSSESMPPNSLMNREKESGDGDAFQRKNKRRKKRRSLLLPSDDEEAGRPLTCAGATHATGESTANTPNNDANASDEGVDLSGTNRNDVLLQSVRDYCSLPVECRVNSKEENRIEELSGYPMPGKLRPVVNNNVTKEKFLLKVQPIVQEMENRKQTDVVETKLATQCEVKKNGKGGYCYYDVTSGEQIQAEEYKLRYNAMLDEKRQKRKRSRLAEERSEQDSVDQAHNDDSINNERGCCDDSNMDMDESVSMDDSVMPLDDSVAYGDKTASSHDGKINASPLLLDNSLVSKDSPSDSTVPPGEGANEQRHPENNIESHPLLAGMPVSNDPRSKSSRVEISKRFTRTELHDACKRHKTKEIAAMAASRKRNAITVQNQRVTRGADPVDTSTQLRSLDAGVKLCARKYNEAKAQAVRLEEEVNSRSDELIELEREAKALHEMLEGNNADARKITQLSAEIQEVNDCSEDTLLYRHQLHHMQHRLGNNSVSLDGHIGEMSATLSSAQKERDRSQKMLAELESGLTCASIELDDTIQDTRITEDERNRELSMKQLEASDAGRMEEWNRERVNSNLAMQVSLADANRSERDRLQRTIRDRQSQLKELSKSMDENAAKLSSFEESFTYFKQATGVNSLTEMVHKITDHEENHLQLMKEKKDAEERLKAAKTSLSKDQEALAQLKTNGFGTTELNRDILDDIKGDIASEKTEGKIVKSTNKRLEDLLIGLRQGGIGLYNRLLPFHSTLLNGEAPKLGEMDSTNAIQAASDTLEMVSFTEKILGKMLIDIGGIRFVDSKADTGKETGPENPTERMNCRVTPKKPNTDEDATEDDDTTVDSCDDVPSRSRVKMTSEMHVEAQRLEELKKRKSARQRVPKSSPTQKGIDYDAAAVAEPHPTTPKSCIAVEVSSKST
ncbi:LOW QUALITY PROTEIN: hypothetical protein ACHAXR_012063 [Thalassiosira sp. AJA248-18]